MDLSTQNIKRRAAELAGAIAAHWLTALIALALAVLIAVGIQKACDRRTERIEDEKIKAYDAEIAERLKVFQSYIDMANRDHQTTTTILDAMARITSNINRLAENDKTITERVNDISANEYRIAREQKNNQTAVRNGTARPAKPVRTREIEALKTDALLYPNN